MGIFSSKQGKNKKSPHRNQTPQSDPEQQRYSSEPTTPSFNNNSPRSTGDPIPVPPRPKPPDKHQKQVVKAIYDYNRRYDDDLSFKKGDKLEIINKGNEDDWWMAMHTHTKKKGYIPCNYVVIDDDSIESQDWWFNLDRRDAIKQLMLPGNPLGTFIVRNSSDKSSYALSLLDSDTTTGQVVIRHFQIRKLDNGGCYISTRNTFKNIKELIEFYKNSNTLGHVLTQACPKESVAIPFKDLEVKRSEIELSNKLGAGQFGEVYSAKFRKVVDVAVKTLKIGSMSPEAFLDEAKIMHKLRHRKLVLLMGVCTVGEPMYIITEKMENGALLDFLRKNNNKQAVKYPDLMDMAAQIADGMMYLELKNYIHRDLRAANILVGENCNIKVADFGLARILDEIYEGEEGIYKASENAKFPIKWTAPEAIMYGKFTIKSDVWSFGVLLYEMVTFGMIPYPAMDNNTTRVEILKGYRMPKPQGFNIVCEDMLYDKMVMCWDKDPDKRPTFEHLKDFFEDYPINTECSYQEG